MTKNPPTTPFATLLRLAQAKGWKTPANNALPDAAWINYWRQCADYERNPDGGRPVVPHRSGRG